MDLLPPEAGRVGVENAALPTGTEVGEGLFSLIDEDALLYELTPTTVAQNNEEIKVKEGEEGERDGEKQSGEATAGEERKRERKSDSESSGSSSPTKNRGLECQLCNIDFKTQQAANGHQKKHRRQCGKCQKQFVNKVQLEVHIRDEHAPEYRCVLCGRKSTDPQNLVVHVLSHDEMRVEAMKVYKHVVPVE